MIPPCRIGIGYDVHRFTADRSLIIGGVDIPYTMGLAGHSDADVLVHAIMDSLLGAAALDDIGVLFPDTDPAYSGISSLSLLRSVHDKLKKRGFQIANIDSVIICQRPKLMPYADEMKRNISSVLDWSDTERIGIKATTTEGCGFVGREEAIAAHAVSLLVLPTALQKNI